MPRSMPLSLLSFLLLSGIVSGDEAQPAAQANAWQSLFDGETLDGWEITEFGGQGDVYVKDDCLIIDFGASMTGVTFEPSTSKLKELPLTNYEIRLEAKRLAGNDFFCGLTFPVKRTYCSLIVGGWGGALVGLSSLDQQDASENETQKIMSFKQDQWYPIRLQVLDDRIVVFIGDKKVIDQSIVKRVISIRPEVDLSKPLGFCTWETRAALRNIALRKISTTRAQP